MEHNHPEAYEHYALIRTNPAYRNFIMLEEMRAEMQPPLSPPKLPEPIFEPEVHHIPVEPEITETNVRKALRQIKGELAFLLKKEKERNVIKRRRSRY